MINFKRKFSSQEWLQINDIYENGVILYKNSYIKILKIKPFNYDLKSNLEKEVILNSYKNFLKICDFDIQILIQSKKEDISKIISQVENIYEENDNVKKIREEYIKTITKVNEEKQSASKNFYIIIKKKLDTLVGVNDENIKQEIRANEYLEECYSMIKEALIKCGNNVECVNTKDDAIKVIKSFI